MTGSKPVLWWQVYQGAAQNGQTVIMPGPGSVSGAASSGSGAAGSAFIKPIVRGAKVHC
jgi:hypothetical protein